MKKALVLCLVLVLCAVSAFAEINFGVWGRVYLEAGDDGVFVKIKETEAPTFTINGVDEDGNIGFTASIKPLSWGKYCINSNIWTSPFVFEDEITTKFTLGGKATFDFSEGSVASDLVTYGACKVTYQDKNTYNLAVGYNPNTLNDYSSGKLYVNGQINFSINSFGTLHLDSASAFDVATKTMNIDYSLNEFTYARTFGEDSPEYANYSKYWYNTTSPFDEDIEKSFNLYNENDIFVNVGPGLWYGYNIIRAGVRYKYYSEENKDAGLYGYSFVNYAIAETYSNITTVVEVGKDGLNFVLDSNYHKEESKIAFRTFANANVNWADDFSCNISDAFFFLVHTEKIKSSWKPEMKLEFINRPYNSAEDNGIYLTAGVYKGFSNGKVPFRVRLGLDGLNNFKWKFISVPEIWF